MSNLLALGPVELFLVLFILAFCIALPVAVIYGIVKLAKFAWKDGK